MDTLESSLNRVVQQLNTSSDRETLRKKVYAIADLFPNDWKKGIAMNEVSKLLDNATDEQVSKVLKVLRE